MKIPRDLLTNANHSDDLGCSAGVPTGVFQLRCPLDI